MNINIKGEGVNYMKKRKTIVLIFLLVFTVINLVGCKNLSKQTKEDIYEDFQKKIILNLKVLPVILHQKKQ